MNWVWKCFVVGFDGKCCSEEYDGNKYFDEVSMSKVLCCVFIFFNLIVVFGVCWSVIKCNIWGWNLF